MDLLDAADTNPQRKRSSRQANGSAWEWDEGTRTCVLLASCAPHELSKGSQFPDASWDGCLTRALPAVLKMDVNSGATFAQVHAAVKKHMTMVGKRYVQVPMVIGTKAYYHLWSTAQRDAHSIRSTFHRLLPELVSTAGRVWRALGSWLR